MMLTGSILCLGDSITYGKSFPQDVPGGYRRPLNALLMSDGYATTFIGSMSETMPDGTVLCHEGWPGYRIDQLAQIAENQPLVRSAAFILLLAGTNDVRQRFNLSTAPERLEALIRSLGKHAPGATLLVGTAPPLRDDPTHPHQVSAVKHYNSRLTVILDRLRSDYPKLIPVDLHGALTREEISPDTVHPTEAGYHKIAQAWHRALTALKRPSFFRPNTPDTGRNPPLSKG